MNTSSARAVMLPQFLRYCLSGGLAAAIHFAILAGLVEAWGFNPTLATSIGFCIGTAFNYLGQYYLTFRAASAHGGTLARYVGVTLVMMGVNVALFWALTHLLAVPYLFAQALATGVVVLCNFAVNRRYTFRQAR